MYKKISTNPQNGNKFNIISSANPMQRGTMSLNNMEEFLEELFTVQSQYKRTSTTPNKESNLNFKYLDKPPKWDLNIINFTNLQRRTISLKRSQQTPRVGSISMKELPQTSKGKTSQ